MRLGPACLRLVDWLADALINGKRKPDSWRKVYSKKKKTVRPETKPEFSLCCRTSAAETGPRGAPFSLCVGSWADAMAQARDSQAARTEQQCKVAARRIIPASSSPAVAARRQAPLAAGWTWEFGLSGSEHGGWRMENAGWTDGWMEHSKGAAVV